jgi:hypothetical protein
MPQSKKLNNGYIVFSPFRSLVNYKEIHKKTAETKGVNNEFMASKTLTSARKILAGLKK